MKTFKQHIKEGGTMGVGTPHQSSVEDGSMGAHNIHEPAILQSCLLYTSPSPRD